MSQLRPNKREVVVHNYHDHANDRIQDFSPTSKLVQAAMGLIGEPSPGAKPGQISFPMRLHVCLSRAEELGYAHIVSW